ncbi:(d)CMP kinase [Proteiniborus sp. MB09-C3]|uniref:(d)CMP kinase n=1 Tax=Proteiniborus sp. MB09-C3 TaxID=3050072 RepID=UPI0025557F29|nr:(d)CMP kinase [Proteiniborus sp. MB09-C3]WIV10951.1 (d)CMP kinase [Proteiniborus sp. MB09-C3]
MGNLTIAIDGPAGSGKSTISKKISKELNIVYIDTGAMYRALTLKILKNKTNIYDKAEMNKILQNTNIDFKNNHIFLDGKKVDEEIRNNEISTNVSDVAKIKEVRKKLVEIQRSIASNKSVIMDGRDIGSFVLPHANYKFYITASIEERGSRRCKELKEKGYNANLEEIIKEIEERDRIDSTREVSPLVKCKDAFEIDTTDKTIDDVVSEILGIIRGDN